MLRITHHVELHSFTLYFNVIYDLD